MFDIELIGQMGAHRLHAIALGCVVPGRDIRDAGLAREMVRGFRDFTTQVDVSACGDRLVKIALRGTRAPRDAPDRPVGVADHEAALRHALEDATAGAREAIVRLLRAVDPKLALDGRIHTSDDGELQAQLRVDPNDAGITPGAADGRDSRATCAYRSARPVWSSWW